MRSYSSSFYQPLISIIVPITDDAYESARRMDLARSQNWSRLEVIPTEAHNSSGIIHSMNDGLTTSKGDFISFLLPGAIYTSDKTARQVAFVERFDLQGEAVFCDYNVRSSDNADGTPIELPSIDPSALLRRIYCGLHIDCSTLMISRKALAQIDLLDVHGGEAALVGFVLSLSQYTNLVGMRGALVSVRGRKTFSDTEKSYLRSLYWHSHSKILQTNEPGIYDVDLFAMLGEAAVARLVQGLPLSAYDTLSVALQLIGHSTNILHAFCSLSKSLLRNTFRILPVRLKRNLRASLSSQAGSPSSRLDFSRIYRDNGFAGTESLSGAGSTLFQTRVIRQKLPKLFRELGIRSIVDIPCGDFHWMRDVELTDIHYTGVDVVQEMVRKNQQLYGGPLRAFECSNLITGPLPSADLVFCRDCLVHLLFDDALAAIETICKSRCKWLLMTTFTRNVPNVELDSVGWRALNLTLAPFNFPKPILLISEKCTEAGGLASDKSLGLWSIAELRHRSGA